MALPLLTNLKDAKYGLTAFGVAFIIFDISFYLMLTLPGTRNNACVDGANLTITNLIFALLVSILMSILVAGFIRLYAQKQVENKAALASLSGLGLIIGSFTLFCGICTIPLLSVFGLAFIANLFTDYNIAFKTISIILMLITTYLLNQQLANKCSFLCKL
ncbi:hypothetical protein COV81_02140 [Candidatus Peregrinibacteria bacterium CG11_big_fil_rev_8_21_14_0_20_41_10]|nr:MAG: hypothetical protein COV81_02140 [Candidatus Peregrinibacteria bacterium CG11_big_fil_rev_8_21_14_0_20_41_10]PIZ73370.1 MAG: hypothetical protein COY06_05405 [Candidatus Peregrinibacteria bacterium CG_4_10_14_0_2_um_filter_41_8]PJC37632.1 MAG: hypothetical protein CO045_04580 [Candidatus Peregrinibacteria bacterium CG_4_9_14_0_2_um_filter_41_14]